MKKIVLLTMCLLAFYNAKAQYIGVKAGYNYANLKGEMSSNASMKAYHGYYAGITLEFPLSKLFSVQVEGIYNRRGANIQSHPYGKAKLSLDYLSAPVLARFNVSRGINLHVGPQLEYRIDKPNFYFDGTDPVTRVKPDALDVIDLGMTAGIAYTTDSGWVFELRYLQGLTSIFENDASLYHTNFSPNYDFKNRTISVGIGYVF